MISAASSDRVNLFGLERARVSRRWSRRLGSKPFRARQLMHWLYKRGEGRIAAMTDLAKDFRRELEARCEVRTPEIVTVHASADGTRKWLLKADAGAGI